MQAVSMQTTTNPATRTPVVGTSGHALATAASSGEALNAARMDFAGPPSAGPAANGVPNAHQPRARRVEAVAYPAAPAEQRVAVRARELGESGERLGVRLLPWVALLIAAAGCSAAGRDQSAGAVAERWALAIRNAASARRSLASFALAKLLQSDSVDVQEREVRPRKDTVVLIQSRVERARGTKLIEVRYTTISGRGADAAIPVDAFAEVVDARGQRVENIEVLD